MPSITAQKHELKADCIEEAMKRYEAQDEAGRRLLFEQALGKIAAKMTVHQLNDWWIILATTMKVGEGA